MELGKKIRGLRFKAGLTQEQLAEKLGVGPQAVSKWENAVAMPDISLLPLLAETFGVSIDELFDLSAEQRLNRIENRLDIEELLPPDVFREYEDFLQAQLGDERNRQRATRLSAYLYWHRMYGDARKVRRYARDAIRAEPGQITCQWMLTMAEGHAVRDWNLANHAKAVDFYREVAAANPTERLPLEYLLDNLLADRRADEAEQVLTRLRALPDADELLCQVYRAEIALARFDAAEAERIMEALGRQYGENSAFLFEAAQYCARKCDYDRAIEYYELAFQKDPARPRFQDALMGMAEIWEIRGDYRRAAETYGRIVELLETEWGLTEDLSLQVARDERARLLARA